MKIIQGEKRKRWDEILDRIKDNKDTVVVEVGVWQGKLSQMILARSKNFSLYMIDRWQKPPADDSYATSGSSISVTPQIIYDNAYHKCVNLAMQHRSRCHVIKCDSVKAADQLNKHSVDLVFIDGDHSYEGCKRDVLAWLSKVKPGCWIGGHDYDHPDQGNVKKAVDEIFINAKIILGANRTWWVKL